MKTRLFWLAIVGVNLLTAAAGWWGWQRIVARRGGVDLNQMAWEATYRERGLPVPPAGPREGYWGSRLWEGTVETHYGRAAVDVHLAGLLDLDGEGFQRLAGTPPEPFHLLIVGGSVAFGAYASSEDLTYFAVARRALRGRGAPVRVTVLAQGAWTSDEEVRALAFALERLGDVDAVVLVGGLNDLTETQGTDGEKAARYVGNMAQAQRLAAARGVACVFALQPFLPAKRHRTRLEEDILRLSGDTRSLGAGLALLREGLAGVVDPRVSRVVDCSEALAGERRTTFSDLWHFSDEGHRLLGECLAAGLEPVVRRKEIRPVLPSRSVSRRS